MLNICIKKTNLMVNRVFKQPGSEYIPEDMNRVYKQGLKSFIFFFKSKHSFINGVNDHNQSIPKYAETDLYNITVMHMLNSTTAELKGV